MNGPVVLESDEADVVACYLYYRRTEVVDSRLLISPEGAQRRIT